MSSPSTANTLWTAMYNFANESPSRVPLVSSEIEPEPNLINFASQTDWYDTISGRQQGFQARPVVGGLYAFSLLNDEPTPL